MGNGDFVKHTEKIQRVWSQELKREKDAKLYILVDPSVRNALHDDDFFQVLLRAGSQASVAPILWQHAVLRPDHRPLLIQLDPSTNAGSELLASSVAMCERDFDDLPACQGQRVCAWLISSKRRSVLQVHLGSLAVQAPPVQHAAELGRRRLFRYYDPLVFPVVLGMCAPAQQQTLLGPLSQWLWLNKKPEGLVCSNTQPLDDSYVFEDQVQELWSRDQWHTILALDAFNPSFIERGLQPHDLIRRDAILQTLARLFKERGRSSELKLFARWAFSHHSQFDQHPYVQTLLESEHALEKLSQLDAAQWDALFKGSSPSSTNGLPISNF